LLSFGLLRFFSLPFEVIFSNMYKHMHRSAPRLGGKTYGGLVMAGSLLASLCDYLYQIGAGSVSASALTHASTAFCKPVAQ